MDDDTPTNSNNNNNINISNNTTIPPLFSESEIICGRKLGQGTFCEVLAIKDIVLLAATEPLELPTHPRFKPSSSSLFLFDDDTTITTTNTIIDDDNNNNDVQSSKVGVKETSSNKQEQEGDDDDDVIIPHHDMTEEEEQQQQQRQQQQQQQQRQRLAYRYEMTRNQKVDRYAAIYGKSSESEQQQQHVISKPTKPKLACKRLLLRHRRRRRRHHFSNNNNSNNYKSKSTTNNNIDDHDDNDDDNDDNAIPTTIAIRDFHREMNILIQLNNNNNHHPNIIELYGIGFDSTTTTTNQQKQKHYQPSSLLLSQIRSTLTQRIQKWRNEQGLGLYAALFNWDVVGRKNLWIERIVLLSKIANAMEYIHQHRIIYRDLKPDNIGIDSVLDDIPKIFDFGLAKYIPPPPPPPSKENNSSGGDDPQQQQQQDDKLFHLTPDTGTLRYMAIEVGNEKSQKYGWSADVYSLGILIHEVLTLKIPFAHIISPTQFRRQVFIQQNEKLSLDENNNWPLKLQNLLTKMWNTNPLERPSMVEVVNELNTMLRGNDEDLFPTNLLLTTKTTTKDTSSSSPSPSSPSQETKRSKFVSYLFG